MPIKPINDEDRTVCSECGSALVLTNGWGVCPKGHGKLRAVPLDYARALRKRGEEIIRKPISKFDPAGLLVKDDVEPEKATECNS